MGSVRELGGKQEQDSNPALCAPGLGVVIPEFPNLFQCSVYFSSAAYADALYIYKFEKSARVDEPLFLELF